MEVFQRLARWFRKQPGFVRSFASAVVIVCLADLTVSAFAPFGVGEGLTARAAMVLQKVIAPFYGGVGLETDRRSGVRGSKISAGQKAVTVVLIDEHYFKATHPQDVEARPVWPLPVANLANLVQSIVDARPAALFIDIALPDAPREVTDGSTNSRKQAMEVLALRLNQLDPSIPVFFSDVIRPTAEQQDLNKNCGRIFVPRGDIAKSSIMAPPLAKALFEPDGPSNGAAAASRPELEVVNSVALEDSGVYHLATAITGQSASCKNIDQQNKNIIASPALALFKAYAARCAAEPAVCGDGSPRDAKARQEVARAAADVLRHPGPPDEHGLRLYDLPHEFREPMSLTWGVRLSPLMRETFKDAAGADRCNAQIFDSALDPAAFYLASMAKPFRQAWAENQARPCPYIDTISAADLLDRRLFDDTAPAGAETRTANLFLKDRIVLLGASIPQAQDRFMSPVNGDIPGVYVHATAIENLITAKDGYRRAEGGPVATLLATMASIFVIAAMEIAWRELGLWFGGWAGRWGEFLLAPLAYAGLMVLACSAAIYILWFFTTLPVTEIAAPIIALHGILFGGYIKRAKTQLGHLLGVKD